MGPRLVGFLPQPGFVISHWQQSPPTCSVLPPCTSYVLVLASIAWGLMCPGRTGPDAEMSWNLLLWDSEILLTWYVRSQQVVERHRSDSWPGLNVCDYCQPYFGNRITLQSRQWNISALPTIFRKQYFQSQRSARATWWGDKDLVIVESHCALGQLVLAFSWGQAAL